MEIKPWTSQFNHNTAKLDSFLRKCHNFLSSCQIEEISSSLASLQQGEHAGVVGSQIWDSAFFLRKHRISRLMVVLQDVETTTHHEQQQAIDLHFGEANAANHAAIIAKTWGGQ